jgi:hypothetical protein
VPPATEKALAQGAGYCSKHPKLIYYNRLSLRIACKGGSVTRIELTAAPCESRRLVDQGLYTNGNAGKYIAPFGRAFKTSAFPQASGSGSLCTGFILASFDPLPLVIDAAVGRVPDAPQPHFTPTVRTDQRVSTRALLIPLSVGQSANDFHRSLDHTLNLGLRPFNQHL